MRAGPLGVVCGELTGWAQTFAGRLLAHMDMACRDRDRDMHMHIWTGMLQLWDDSGRVAWVV